MDYYEIVYSEFEITDLSLGLYVLQLQNPTRES